MQMPKRSLADSMSDKERDIIISFCHKLKVKRILNIGTHNGYTVLKMGEKLNSKITTVDIVLKEDFSFPKLKSRKNSIRALIKREFLRNSDQIVQEKYYQLCSTTFNNDKYFREYLNFHNIRNIVPYSYGSDHFFENNSEKFDAIILDGDHTYFQTKSDLENSLNVINEGGIIFMHDINPHPRNSTDSYWWNSEKSCYEVFIEHQGPKKLFDTEKKLGIIYTNHVI